jgi:hypothetical protein
MIKREAKLQTQFTSFLKQKKLQGYYELKHSTTDAILFSSVEAHQVQALLNASLHGLVWKISDSDPRTKPFDCFCAPPMRSYVVIRFKSGVVAVGVDEFIAEKITSGEKKLTYEKAKQIAAFSIKFKSV